MTCTGERKISAVFRRFLDNLGELAYMTKDDTSEGAQHDHLLARWSKIAC